MAKGIYKRGNIYWIRYAGTDGKTVFESSGSTRFKDAQTFLLKRKQAVAEGKQPLVKKISNHAFKDLAARYSEWMQGRHRSSDSKAYRIKGMDLRFGNLPLTQFNTLLIEQYQTELMNQRREIPINSTLRETLQGLRRRLDISHVFYDPTSDKPYKDVKHSFKTALRCSKINDFRLHDLRHTFASHLVMAGIDLTTMKELLGHKTLTMTLRNAHFAP